MGPVNVPEVGFTDVDNALRILHSWEVTLGDFCDRDEFIKVSQLAEKTMRLRFELQRLVDIDREHPFLLKQQRKNILSMLIH